MRRRFFQTNRIARTVIETVRLSLDQQLPRASAAWSFFILLSIFPFLICLNALLSFFHLGFPDIVAAAGRVLPAAAAQFLEDYLHYVTAEGSTAMLAAGVLMMATSSSAAFRTVLNITGELYGKKRFPQLRSWLISFLYAFVFLLAVYVCIVVSVFGNALIGLINRWLPFSPQLLGLLWLRYPVLAVFVFVILYGMYRLTVPKRKPRHPVWIGALFGAAAFVAVGMIYSALIGLSAKYSLVYGSLASVVVLMLWIYTCSYVIFIGAALNRSVSLVRDGDRVPV